MRSGKRLGYVCLQATRQGQASHAHVHEIVAGLQRRGWSVKLFEPRYAGENSGPPPSPVGRLIEFARVQSSVVQALPEIDVLYVRGHFATWPVVRRAAAAGVKVVIEVNGPHADMYLSWPGLRVARPLVEGMVRAQLRTADAVVTVTPGLGDWVRSQAPVRSLTIIPNGANTSIFAPGAPCTRELPSRYVVFFGALAVWQGIRTMLEATRQEAWPPDVKLLIAGDGAERELVQQSAAASGRVIYLGSLPYADIAGVVSRSLAGLIVKNDRENGASTGLSPLKLYETLACGVPAIVSDLPGQAELVRASACGLVVPPADPAALAHAVAQVAGDVDARRKYGANARRTIVEQHSWDHRAESTHILLTELVDSAAEPARAIVASASRSAGTAPDNVTGA